MASLKELRGRIGSVKQTQKITSAMKLVAASKLRRAQEQAEASRPFASRMDQMLANLAAGVADIEGSPPLLAGTGKQDVHLLVVATADRGLCGGFNSSIARGTRRRVHALQQDGKQVKLLCVGRMDVNRPFVWNAHNIARLLYWVSLLLLIAGARLLIDPRHRLSGESGFREAMATAL
jgi:ATP synthase F1 gamma subunit